ncbi:MAG TPA: hypothetical protein VFH48_21175 [Chloroflexota bacterium]|nr:hypothetical protein [Chloroflexota bacterium]
MKRYLAESMVIVAASIVLVLGTLAMGSMALRDDGPSPQLSRVKMPGCLDVPVVPIDNSGIAGQAQLCITDEAVRPSLRVANLTPDTAYLALFEYFEQPTACLGDPCGYADLRSDGTGGTLARMDAAVAGGARRAEFWGDFRDISLKLDAQVTLLLFDRGTVRGGNGQYRAHLLLSLPIVPPDGRAGTGSGGDRGIGRAVAQAHFLPPAAEEP